MTSEKKKPVDRRDRRDRSAKKGQKSMKEWNDMNKWNSMLVGMTIPHASPLKVISIERNTATFEWSSNFAPAADDKSKFGFNVTLCQSAGLVVSNRENTCTTHIYIPGDDSKKHIFKELSPKVGQSFTLFRSIMNDLQPGLSYRAQIAYTYSNVQSETSDWVTFNSNPVTPPSEIPLSYPLKITQKTCTSVQLKWHRPLDDGGSLITGYHVYARHAPSNVHLHEDWKWWGEFRNFRRDEDDIIFHLLDVSHLLPNTEYQFKIKAYNNVGNSSLSIPSEPFHIKCVQTNEEIASHTIYGVGGQKHYASLPDKIPSKEETPPMLTLDDIQQVIHCEDHPDVKALVWTAHYSPKLFNVIAEAVNVRPYLLEKHITNVEEVFGKIAIVQRGIVPMVHKVLLLQTAGAVGVVITDDGRCKAYDQLCCPAATKARGEQWGRFDKVEPWKNVRIPVVLISRGIEDKKAGRCLFHERYVRKSEEEKQDQQHHAYSLNSEL